MTSQAQALRATAGRARTRLPRLSAASGRQAGARTRAAPGADRSIPMLFVQGTRDALAEPRAAASRRSRRLGARARTCTGSNEADHSFHVPARTGRKDAQVRGALLAAAGGLDGGAVVSKRALERYAAKRTFTRTPEPPARTAGRAARAAHVRRAEARGAAPALRLSARTRRRAEVLGGAQGPLARSGRQAHGGRGRGSPVRLRLLRGRDPGEAVRRGQRDRLGLRRLLPR